MRRLLSRHEAKAALATVVAAVFTFALTIGPDSKRFYSSLLQAVIVLVIGYASYEFGKASALTAAEDMIKPHVRSAFRRIVALGDALTRFLESIERQRAILEQDAAASNGMNTFNSVTASLALLNIQITEQLDTANAAVAEPVNLVETVFARN
jgi:hypothetical protein